MEIYQQQMVREEDKVDSIGTTPFFEKEQEKQDQQVLQIQQEKEEEQKEKEMIQNLDMD